MEPLKSDQSNLDCSSLRAKSPGLIGTAGYGAVCPVVWDSWLTLVSHGDPILNKLPTA